jgi:hypothetical protein
MTPESVGPLTRPVSVANLPAEGLAFTVEATAEERAALARDFALEGIKTLTGRFTLTGSPERVHVVGRVEAQITQTCVVTLDAFGSTVSEEVDVDFLSGEPVRVRGMEDEAVIEAPLDRISGTHIDVGALTAEFLALGLDPYPRKPGADFSDLASEEAPESPFAKLKALKPDT